MKDAQKPDHVSLNTLVARLKDGRYVIPDFQREFEWKPWDLRELMRSIFLDYYIGSLLLWKGKKENFTALSCEPIYGFSGNDDRQDIVLDGQQRLTAIYYAFMMPDMPLPNRATRAFYYIRVDRFMAEEHDEAFHYEWFSRYWSKFLEDPAAQYEHHVFPLSVVGQGGWHLYEWIQEYERFWRERGSAEEANGNKGEAEDASQHAANATAFGEHIKGIAEEYQVAYVELDQELTVDKVCDIFTQVNSRGVRLDVFDLMNALLKPKGLQLKHMWRAAEPRLAFVESEKMNVYILQVMSILRQNYCSPKYLYFLLPGQERPIRDPDGTRRKEVMVQDQAEFERRWNDAVDALESAINLLKDPREYGAINSGFIPYVTILPVFAALHARAARVPPERRLDARRKVRHWYWASVFTARYSGSVESTSSRDYLDVEEWIEAGVEPALVEEFKERFQRLDLRSEVKRGTSVYNGIFNLLVLNQARDWISGDLPQYGDVDDHHIVPVSWGRKNLTDTAQINSILNRTPLTAETNRNVIGDRLPNKYLPELFLANGEETVRAVLGSHYVSSAAIDVLLRDPFTPSDFEAFLIERQRTLLKAIEQLFVKEQFDIAPELRSLNEDIEKIELALRRCLAEGVNHDTERVPSHLVQNADEKIKRALAKNAALDGDRYRTLEGRLEYFDLRGVGDALRHKSLWPLFQDRFGSPQTLANRFDQLAELRNAIRHSHSIHGATLKDGEAAIIWFKEVLAK